MTETAESHQWPDGSPKTPDAIAVEVTGHTYGCNCLRCDGARASASAARTRRMSITEVDDSTLVLVLRKVEPLNGPEDPYFGCNEGCPVGEHWHVNSYRGPDYDAERVKVRSLLAEWVRDDA